VNSEIKLYFRDPLKGMIISGSHSDKAFIFRVALNFRLMLDVDSFGDMVHSKFILSAILAEILYLENKFFLAESVIRGVSLSDIFIS
jgi:hypothetical protein